MSRDRTSFDGGYSHVVRRMDREQPDIYALSQWRAEHCETPTNERTSFWVGADCAISDAIGANPDREEVA